MQQDKLDMQEFLRVKENGFHFENQNIKKYRRSMSAD